MSEDGSLGEASATCAGGTGGGITAVATGWVTLGLLGGRYEIVGSLPGRCTARMHNDVVST